MSGLAAPTKQNNKEEIVRRLQNGADINEQDKYGETALNSACWKNHTELAEILLTTIQQYQCKSAEFLWIGSIFLF